MKIRARRSAEPLGIDPTFGGKGRLFQQRPVRGKIETAIGDFHRPGESRPSVPGELHLLCRKFPRLHGRVERNRQTCRHIQK